MITLQAGTVDRDRLAQYVNGRMRARGLNQSQLARRMVDFAGADDDDIDGISAFQRYQRLVNRILHSKADLPDVGNLTALADALGCEVSDLIAAAGYPIDRNSEQPRKPGVWLGIDADEDEFDPDEAEMIRNLVAFIRRNRHRDAST